MLSFIFLLNKGAIQNKRGKKVLLRNPTVPSIEP